MSEIARLNLTYHMPIIDFDHMTGYNPDGKINIPFTIIKMRNHLQKNLDTINKLLENISHVSDIGVSEYEDIYVVMDTPEIQEKLIRDKVLKKNMTDSDDDDPNIISENTDIPAELLVEQEPETNANRLAMINNLVNQDNYGMINGKNTDDEDDDVDVLGSDKEPLFEDINVQKVIGKYERIMAASKNYYSDNSQEYGSSDSE